MKDVIDEYKKYALSDNFPEIGDLIIIRDSWRTKDKYYIVVYVYDNDNKVKVSTNSDKYYANMFELIQRI